MKLFSVLMCSLLALVLVACSSGGDGAQRDSNVRADVTGPTQPTVVVNCEAAKAEAARQSRLTGERVHVVRLGDTVIDTDVDCGDRNVNPAPVESGV